MGQKEFCTPWMIVKIKIISQKKYIIKPKQTQTYIPKFCSFFYWQTIVRDVLCNHNNNKHMFGNTRGSNEFETERSKFLKRWGTAPEFLRKMIPAQKWKLIHAPEIPRNYEKVSTQEKLPGNPGSIAETKEEIPCGGSQRPRMARRSSSGVVMAFRS